MIKIHRKPDITYWIRCKRCDCVFSAEWEDVIMDDWYENQCLQGSDGFVPCPVCHYMCRLEKGATALEDIEP